MTFRLADEPDQASALRERLWAQVDKENGPVHPTLGRCWVWTGYTRNRYGALSVHGRPEYAHRLSYELHFGSIAIAGAEVLHRCDNPPCVRPEHLLLGSHTDNVRDMWAKGRASDPPHTYGEDHHMTTLTDSQVEEIRAIRASRSMSQRATARKYGVSQSTVWRLAHRIYRSGGPS